MIRTIKFVKGNLFLSLIIFCYIILAIFKPDLGIQGVKNSGYYIKEMLMIMPVIFVLTALLDTWISKETIIKYLGKDTKAKGVLCAFIIGSISAGPIYAAFPFCVMLHKKGASINNLVIILSSWAVVKVPMLLNESKFLGPKFMLIRWTLTVIAIIFFSWLTAKIVKDKDLPQRKEERTGIFLNRDACIGCTFCCKKYPEVFEMVEKKANIKKFTELDCIKLKEVIISCPVRAINYKEY